MTFPEHLNITRPESSPDEEIKVIKLKGRKMIEDINKLVDEGENEEDKDRRAEIKKEAENKLKELNKLRRQLGILKGEITEKDFSHEQYLSDIHPFLIETYKDKWSYNEEQLKTVSEVTSNPDNIHIDEEIPFDTLIEENKSPNPTKAGEIYLSSETTDFENAKVFIPEIPDDIKSQGVGKVMEYIIKTYEGKYIIPDIKYYKHLAELGDQYNKETDETKKRELLKLIPEQLRDGNWYYFPKSAFVFMSGCWCCFDLGWDGGLFDRFARRLDRGWDSSYRVVLLEIV